MCVTSDGAWAERERESKIMSGEDGERLLMKHEIDKCIAF